LRDTRRAPPRIPPTADGASPCPTERAQPIGLYHLPVSHTVLQGIRIEMVLAQRSLCSSHVLLCAFCFFFTVLKFSFLAEVPREPLVVGGLHMQPSIVLPAIVASASQSPTGIFFNG